MSPSRLAGRLRRLRRSTSKSFFESSSREALAPCAATHPILRSSVRERHSVRAKRGGVAPFPPSLTLFALILFPRAQSVFLPRRRARWEARLAGGPRTAQARGLPARMVGQGAGRLPVRQKNPAGAPKAREAEHGRGMGGSARGGRGRRGGRPLLSQGIDTLTAYRPFSLPCLWPSTVRTAAQAPRGTAGLGAGRVTEARRDRPRRLALRRPSGLAAWASFWRGVVPGSVPGLLPRRPRRIALRRSRLACARRLALPLGRRIAASVGAPVRPPRGVLRDVRPGAQGRGSVGMRLAARGRPGIAGVVPGSVTGLCPSVPGRRRAAAGGRCSGDL